ncbi:MAG: diacylglycerol kinase [Betaproteobacteria bacterium RBG_16_66_20]|nr:MAG: diacylglycerol kinase [Betaproteobacteria bacterium RBG_16_66_20]
MSQIGGPGPPPVAPGTTRIYLIAAVAKNGVIGARGKLPWHLPEDLRHFKKLTLGHPVIMGRRTWESLGRPLPGRDNIVVTRTTGYEAPGASVAASLAAAIALCSGEPVAFVIGGAEIYAAALALADGLVLTEIQQDFEGDTHFPQWDRSAWRVSQKETHTAADGVRFDFVLYERA